MEKTDDKQLLMNVGQAIKAARKAKRLSQEKLAEKTDLHPTYISKLEAGNTNATIMTLQSISLALDIQLSDFFNTTTDQAISDLFINIVSKTSSIDSLEKNKLIDIINYVVAKY